MTECGRSRDLVRHEELHELGPARDRARPERVGVHAVLERDPDVLVVVQVRDALGEVAAGLLVLELADEEDGHLRVLEPRARRALREQRRRPERVLAPGSSSASCVWRRSFWLAMQCLSPCLVSSRAHGWPPAGAGLASSMRSWIQVLREAGVEDAARVAGAGVECRRSPTSARSRRGAGAACRR